MTSIGFVGLGSMGLPMAQNLLARSFTVRGFDIRADAIAAIEAHGGTGVSSAAAAATAADALILMVVNANQASGVLFDANAAAALPKGALVLLMATCAPTAVRLIGEKLERMGLHLLDAPVSGGVEGAKSRTLTIMCGGPDATFLKARPILDALGDKVFHVGRECGQGAVVKSINQLLCGVHIAAAAEAVVMAEKAGLEARTVLEILGGSAASSWMLKDRGPRMLSANPQVASAVDIFVKDLGIVLDTGRAVRNALPLAAAAHQMFLAASGMGIGGKDDSHVVEVYRVLAGLKAQ